MLYFVFGNDVKKSHNKLDSLRVDYLKKDKNLSVFRFSEEDFDSNVFENSLKSNNFFSNKNLIISKRLLSKKESKDYILDNLEKLNKLEDTFIFWEESIKKLDIKKIKKYISDKNIFEFNAFIKDERKEMNNKIYRITDLVAGRKKNDAWLTYQREVFNGLDVEEVFWRIVWQMKSILIVKKGGGKEMKPYPYGKSQRAAILYEEKELQNKLSELIDIYHKDRRGAGDLEINLEKFLLRI